MDTISGRIRNVAAFVPVQADFLRYRRAGQKLSDHVWTPVASDRMRVSHLSAPPMETDPWEPIIDGSCAVTEFPRDRGT